MYKYMKYLGGVALLALCSCSDENTPVVSTGEVVKSFSIGVDADIMSRAEVMPGDGSDILELAYVIRDDNNEVVYATGVGSSPEPVKSGNHWTLDVTLPAGKNYSALFWADKEGVTGVASDWRNEAAQRGSSPVSTIVANADSLYVRRNNGWAGIADDAMSKYFTFNSNDNVGNIVLTRPLCQILVGAAADKVLEETVYVGFGFLDDASDLLSSGMVLFDAAGGDDAEAAYSHCVLRKMADPTDYTDYSFPFQKEGESEYYLVGGGYFSPASLSTAGLHANTLVIYYSTTADGDVKSVNVALDKLAAPMKANSQLVVVLYPSGEESPVTDASTAMSRSFSANSNNIVIPVAI